MQQAGQQVGRQGRAAGRADRRTGFGDGGAGLATVNSSPVLVLNVIPDGTGRSSVARRDMVVVGWRWLVWRLWVWFGSCLFLDRHLSGAPSPFLLSSLGNSYSHLGSSVPTLRQPLPFLFQMVSKTGEHGSSVTGNTGGWTFNSSVVAVR